MASHPVIHCQGVTKTFQGTPAVRDVSLFLEQGEILALVGPSGCGKTTLLRLVAGFESPNTGTITLDGRPVAGRGSWVSPEARQLGMVFQDYALFPNMTVVQNIAFGLGKLSRQAREDRVGEMLEMVRLNHLADRYPHQLSGGEQQRVALARSLAPHPLALLLDEPFSSLDPQLRAQLREEVKNILQSSGVTTIYVTHDQEEALFMGDKVAVMTSGSLEQVGTPEDIFHHPKTRFVAYFLVIAVFNLGRVDGYDL
ncbi:MAG: ABC transporter ATP-binding protein, partial [Dehalococcoidia bacterium]|nr:ABC transporter ATP-binding protein [Dehalococcoidia bacterium]